MAEPEPLLEPQPNLARADVNAAACAESGDDTRRMHRRDCAPVISEMSAAPALDAGKLRRWSFLVRANHFRADDECKGSSWSGRILIFHR